MSVATPADVVVDTMVISWLLGGQPKQLAEGYRELIGSRSVLLSVQTLMEIQYGALVAGWGAFRRRRLDRDLAELTVVEADDDVATVCANLRWDCRRAGHALADKIHDGDRWIAATGIHLKLPLASHDGIYRGTPGLQLLTLRSD